MNRITKTFNELQHKGQKALIAFVTGGDPDIQTTEKLILAMEEAGVDIVEIGIPFSDPIAEGIVIQGASKRALDGGCTVDKLFSMVKRLREKTDMPLLFMTYANPIYGYGKERFMANCRDTGVDGIIVPDIPFEEKDEFEKECIHFGINQISLIAPTSGERVEKIATEARGFLYCVSSLGVTGVRSEISTSIAELISRVKKVSSIPCAIGFGISTPKQAYDMAEISDGIIVGSAIVKIVAEYGKDSEYHVKNFLSELKKAIRVSEN